MFAITSLIKIKALLFDDSEHRHTRHQERDRSFNNQDAVVLNCLVSVSQLAETISPATRAYVDTRTDAGLGRCFYEEH